MTRITVFRWSFNWVSVAMVFAALLSACGGGGGGGGTALPTGAGSTTTEVLSFQVTDAEYSDALESVVMVSAENSALYIFDTTNRSTRRVPLPLSPTCVSISPDGLFAAVGHAGSASYVDLSTRTLVKTFAVTTDVVDIVLDGNGYVHVFPSNDGLERVRSVNVATEMETPTIGQGSPRVTVGRLHVDGAAMYGATTGVSPSDIEKYDISGGTASYLYESPYHGDYRMCGNLWISEDGLRLFTRCGNVFRSSPGPTEDMIYNGTLPNIDSINITNIIESLSHSREAGEIAAIVASRDYSSDPSLVSEICFYDYESLTATGCVNLADYSLGGSAYAASGKFVFYSGDGSRYFVIARAGTNSGLLNYDAILMSPPLGAGGGSNDRPVADAGPDRAASIGNPASLDGSSSSDADGDSLTYEWEIVSRPTASAAILIDPSTPNPQLTPDLPGAYVIGLVVNDGSVASVQDTVTVTAVNSGDQFLLQLDYRVADAEYSDTLERIVAVSSADNRLYMFDVISYDQLQLGLPLKPTSVSVSPDGLYAAIGHNGSISYVDLRSNTLVKTFTVTANVFDVVLDGNGYVHAFGVSNGWDYVRSIHIETEVETPSSDASSMAPRAARLQPGGRIIYTADEGSFGNLSRYENNGGTLSYVYDFTYYGDYPICDELWLSEDGLRGFTGCGNVFNTPSDPTQDITYAGALPITNSVVESLSHSLEAAQVAAFVIGRGYDPDPLMDTEIRLYNYPFLNDTGRISLPGFEVGNNTYASHGKFIFHSSDGTRYFAIVQADPSSGLLNDYGISVH